jgi:hypothetical protein
VATTIPYTLDCRSCASRGRLVCVAYPSQQPAAARAQHLVHLRTAVGRHGSRAGEPPRLEPPSRLRVAAHRLAHGVVRLCEGCRRSDDATSVEVAGGVALERLWPVDDPFAEEVGQVTW